MYFIYPFGVYYEAAWPTKSTVFLTWQYQDSGRPACGARELLELGPGVDGVMGQGFAP